MYHMTGLVNIPFYVPVEEHTLMHKPYQKTTPKIVNHQYIQEKI